MLVASRGAGRGPPAGGALCRPRRPAASGPVSPPAPGPPPAAAGGPGDLRRAGGRRTTRPPLRRPSPPRRVPAGPGPCPRRGPRAAVLHRPARCYSRPQPSPSSSSSPPSPLRWDYAAICVNFAPRRAASSQGAAAPLSRGRGMSGACGRGCGLAAPCPPPRLPGPRAGDERGAEAASPCGSRERLAVPHRSVCGKFSGAFAHPNFGCGLAGKQMGERNNALNGNL